MCYKNHNYNCHHITFPFRSKCKCHQSLVIKWTPAVINQTAVIVGAATERAREGYCCKMSCHEKCSPLPPVPSGYPNPTRFSFGNHRVAGNPKHRVLPDISGEPEVSGTTDASGITRNLRNKRKTIPSSDALLWEPQKGPHGAKKVQNLPF